MRLIFALAAVAVTMTASPGHAHHSFAAEFTSEATATITGTVSEVWFRNPHVRYYIDVSAEDGDIVEWDTRGPSPSLLTRRGWTKTRIRVGDTVTIKGFRATDKDRKLLSIIWVELADGTRLK